MATRRIGLFAIVLIALQHRCVWAQDSSPPQTGQRGRSRPLSSSVDGIRGAAAPPPDGWLVSGDEARLLGGEQGYAEAAALRPRAVTPTIEIAAPELAPDTILRSPLSLVLRFQRQADAAIDPASFRMLYGASRTDITLRVTDMAAVTAEGVTLASVSLPPGRHLLVLQVQDAKGRLAERELRLVVQ